MRVLQVDTERGWRGGQRQTLLLSQELLRHGHQVAVVARADDLLAERAMAAGLRVIAVHPWSEIALGTAVGLRRLIRREHIEIVHAQTAHAVTLAILSTVGTRARVVVTRHLARRLRDNAGTRWKYRRVDAILAVSNAAAEALAASGIGHGRVEVVHGGVELDRDITPAPRRNLIAFGVPPGAPLAVMVGALVPQKDPLTFVRAIAAARRAVPSLQALIVGEGELRASVEAEVTTLGLEGAVHLTGFRTDVDELLAAADVAVLSSRFEGLPLVAMDALVLGVPLAATAGEGIPEVVTDGETGLLAPVGDYDSLGAAIARIAADRELREHLAAGARRHAPEFSIDHTARLTIDAYRRVLDRTADASAAVARTASASAASSASSTRAP